MNENMKLALAEEASTGLLNKEGSFICPILSKRNHPVMDVKEFVLDLANYGYLHGHLAERWDGTVFRMKSEYCVGAKLALLQDYKEYLKEMIEYETTASLGVENE